MAGQGQDITEVCSGFLLLSILFHDNNYWYRQPNPRQRRVLSSNLILACPPLRVGWQSRTYQCTQRVLSLHAAGSLGQGLPKRHRPARGAQWKLCTPQNHEKTQETMLPTGST